jgi:hypothetical protein
MMSVDPNGLNTYGANIAFMLNGGGMCFPIAPALTSVVIVAMFPALRHSFKDKWVLTAYLLVSLLWLFLIPWSAIFIGAEDGGHDSPGWAYIPLKVDIFGWPVVAAFLLFRAKGARAVSFIHILCNVPGWLLGGLIAAMAISGDWV